MGRPFKNRYQLGDIHAMVAISLILPHPTGRSLTVGDPPVGMRPVNQAVAFANCDRRRCAPRLPPPVRSASSVPRGGASCPYQCRRADGAYRRIPVPCLPSFQPGLPGQRKKDCCRQPDRPAPSACRAKIVVGSQIDQHRPLVGRRFGSILLVAGRQQEGKQKKGEQEPMFHRRILH